MSTPTPHNIQTATRYGTLYQPDRHNRTHIMHSKHIQPLALAAVLVGEVRRMQMSTPPRGFVSVPSCAHAARATHMHSQAPMCSRHTHLPPLYSNTHLTREVDGVQYLPSHPRKARHPTPHSHRGEDKNELPGAKAKHAFLLRSFGHVFDFPVITD